MNEGEREEATQAGDAAVQLPAHACLALCTQLPRAPGLGAALGIVEGVRRDLLGEGLLTVHASLPCGPAGNEIELQRLWSSDAAAYPLSGRKRKTMTGWTQQLLVRGEVFVGEGEAALARAFDDHALIASLGLRSIVNVPLSGRDGAVLATFNVLSGRPHWKPGEVLLVRLLAALAAPAILQAAGELRG